MRFSCGRDFISFFQIFILVSRQVYIVAMYLYTGIQFEGIEHEKIHRNTF